MLKIFRDILVLHLGKIKYYQLISSKSTLHSFTLTNEKTLQTFQSFSSVNANCFCVIKSLMILAFM